MSTEIKEQVREKYSEIATAVKESGCGCYGCCGQPTIEVSMIGNEYKGVEGHIEEADLGLGCGLPTEHAAIKPGDTVLDLGCGAGNDVFISAIITGNTGRVIGLDFTPEMLERAKKNQRKLHFNNVEFRLGDIESMPVEDNSVDVVISNCVLNLVPDKAKAFSEIKRVLKPGGHFCVSDIVFEGYMPDGLRKSIEMYAGCISGALEKDEYLSVIKKNGFKEINAVKYRKIEVPDEVFEKYFSKDEIDIAKKSHRGVYSITVTAKVE
ncbi:MAG: arsenite methyltransferase [Ignavibacteria bacterium]|nr:arsenite methyltransferase [Ignavibacteria bacterium]